MAIPKPTLITKVMIKNAQHSEESYPKLNSQINYKTIRHLSP